jgi:hypothetical protein
LRLSSHHYKTYILVGGYAINLPYQIIVNINHACVFQVIRGGDRGVRRQFVLFYFFYFYTYLTNVSCTSSQNLTDIKITRAITLTILDGRADSDSHESKIKKRNGIVRKENRSYTRGKAILPGNLVLQWPNLANEHMIIIVRHVPNRANVSRPSVYYFHVSS